MAYTMKPLGCDPAWIKGMSERLIISHYEKAKNLWAYLAQFGSNEKSK
jgi:hypothetical protein